MNALRGIHARLGTVGMVMVGAVALALIYATVTHVRIPGIKPFRHFSWHEFDTGATEADIASGAEVWYSDLHENYRIKGSGRANMQRAFVRALDRVQGDVDFDMDILSGFRSFRWNAHVGGVSNSTHMDGWAADIRVRNDAERWAIARAAVRHGITRIGWGSGFIHLDMHPDRPQRTTWGYPGAPSAPTYATILSSANSNMA